MAKKDRNIRLAREGWTQTVALGILLALGAYIVMGPSGVLAWGENHRLLMERQREKQALTQEQSVLRNRVDLLNPRNADPDMAGEMMRRQLKFVYPNERVITIQ